MITDRQIAKALKEVAGHGKPRTLVDPGQYGDGRLMLLVRRRGTAAYGDWFAVQYRDGKKAMRKVGSLSDMTPAQARARFAEAFAPAIREGRDPGASIAAKVAPVVSAGGTVAELFQAYTDDLRGRGRRSWKAAHYALRPVVEAIGGDLPAAAVTRDHLIPYLRAMHSRGAPVGAATARGYLAAAFAFGLKAGGSYTRGNVGDRWKLSANPVASIEADAEAVRARDRYLSPAEVCQLWNWLSTFRRESLLAAAVMLRIATGQRSEEILRIARRKGTGMGFYDQAAGTIEWGETKNGLPHVIPLPRQAIEVLALLAMMPARGDFFFSRLGDPTRPATAGGLLYVIGRFLKAHPSVEHFEPRDLRRTFKTLAGKAGVSKIDRDLLQNHSKGDVSARHYDRWAALPEKREAMKTWEDFLAKIIAGEDLEEPTEVVMAIDLVEPEWARADWRPPAQ